MRRWVVALLLAGLLAEPASAHRLRVFAVVAGPQIEGSVYFSGGAPAAGVRVEIRDAAGARLAELRSDAQGGFRWPWRSAGPHRVVADSGDGHVAEWSLGAGEFGPDGTAVDGPAPAVTVPPVAGRAVTAQEVAVIVAGQVRPLREQLIAYEDRLRLRDLLGGLGYIAGLAGLALWWRARRSARRR